MSNSKDNTTNNKTDQTLSILDKVVTEFGATRLTSDLCESILNLGKDIPLSKNAFRALFDSGLIVSHRNLERLIDCVNKSENFDGHFDKFYIYTGRGPSSQSIHLGHTIPLLTAKFLQDIFDCPVFIQLSTDEKFLRDKLSIDQVSDMAVSNAKQIMSLGFNPNKTIILSNLDAIKQFYPTALTILKHTSVGKMRDIFGFDDSGTSGNFFFPVIESCPAFHVALKGIIDNHKQCLVVLGLDQDPFFRLARDVAVHLKCSKPMLLHTAFVPGLKNIEIKMSSSDPQSAIFLSDTNAQIKRKINKYAFSGGQDTKELQKQLGADLSVDVSCKYLQLFSSFLFALDSSKSFDVESLLSGYRDGSVLTGEIKEKTINVLCMLFEIFNKNNDILSNKIEDIMSIRNISNVFE